jgi:NADH-quinone oxidoreductase subunit H
MGNDIFEIVVNSVKLLAIFLLMVQLVPILVWVERRGSAFIQSRLGPNRVGPLGLTQLLADAVKFVTKEDFISDKTVRSAFYLAPIVALVPAAVALGSIPLSHPIAITAFEMFGQTWGPYNFYFQTFYFGIGIVFVLGISSLGAYSLLLSGWGSANKYSLMGALRASAQMISYELALGLSLVGVILIYGTFDFLDMINQQMGPLEFSFMGKVFSFSYLPNWGIFYQPLGAILYFCAIFAEANRTPFDLPEAEGELVAGYHTEYGGMKMLLFYIGEYGHMMVGSALMAIFYFGGYDPIFFKPADVIQFLQFSPLVQNVFGQGLSINMATTLSAFLFHIVLMTKILFFLWIFIWVRWTVPRFRYDQLMDIGWKKMLPWALANTIITAVLMAVARISA